MGLEMYLKYNSRTLQFWKDGGLYNDKTYLRVSEAFGMKLRLEIQIKITQNPKKITNLINI